MDQFTYVADPGRSLRVHNSRYSEQVQLALWRSDHHLGGKRPTRSRRGAKRSLRLVGSAR